MRRPTGGALRVARVLVLAAACVRFSGATTSDIHTIDIVNVFVSVFWPTCAYRRYYHPTRTNSKTSSNS